MTYLSRKQLGGLLFASMLAIAGCAGSDGSDGAPGRNGTDGTPGQDGQDLFPAAVGAVVVSNAAAAVSGADLVVTYNVKVGGENRDDFTTLSRVYRHVFDPTLADTTTSGSAVIPVKNKYRRISMSTADTQDANTPYAVTVVANGSGDYTVTVVGAGAVAGAADERFLVTTENAQGLVASAVALNAGARALVTDAACMNCHGNNVFYHEGEHHGANPQGVTACLVCHTRYNSASRGQGGDRLASYVHGIHNSHEMPARDVDPSPASTVIKPAGYYARNDSTNSANWFSVGFPGHIINCAACHTTAAGIAAATNLPISRENCFTCHDSFEGWDWAGSAAAQKAMHLAFPTTQVCSVCHTGAPGPKATAGEFHNGLKTGRSGVVWNAQDQSIVQGQRIAMQITGVSYDPVGSSTLAITWTAQLDGVDVDPCNAVVSSSAPLFHLATANAATGQANQNFSILTGYAQGDDWVANLATTTAGQPKSVNLSATNTSCAANVATTRIAADATTATRGQVALQGKPQIAFDPAVGTSVAVIQVRAQTPVREFMVADGAAPTATRRQIVSVDKCNACHAGSLYQHGGNRVDRVELCIMCHNPASFDTYRTTVGVTQDEAYDGKVGTTFDLRTMVHAIHSSGVTGAPWVIYRSNGIYAFGTQAAIDALPNWPGPGNQTIFGSSPATLKTHNEIVVHYPRALNDCGACHVNDSEKSLPDPTKAVAVTVDPGTLQGANGWIDQLDDTLIGPSTASCMSCHQSGVAFEQAGLQFHAYDNGFAPSVLAGGRQDVLDLQFPAVESCFVCHGAGKVADIGAVHSGAGH
jgi:OmcA/MtrC family decaheme c-type cytochrome